MIGFDRNGHQGKTPEELIEEAEAERIWQKQTKYIDNFGIWVDEQTTKDNENINRYKKMEIMIMRIKKDIALIHSAGFYIYTFATVLTGFYAHIIVDTIAPDGFAVLAGQILKRILIG